MEVIEGNNNMKVTSIAELALYGKGQVVELPEFGEGQRFFARLRRPSMIMLCKTGKIPNTLLAKANELFNKPNATIDPSSKDSSETYELIDIILDAAFVEPTYHDMVSAGIQLTDEQILAVFNYTQNGVMALESFRRKREVLERSRHSKDVQQASE